KWAKEAGLTGIVLSAADEEMPFFHSQFDPIWSLLEDLEMPVATHAAVSSVSKNFTGSKGMFQAAPSPACASPLMTAITFFCCQQIFHHMIWGGVLERHPRLQLVLTEQGSGWVVTALRGMDYTWERSYLRRDVREIVKRKPSEYFERQVYLGSSLFSRAEAEARHEIGIDKSG